MIKHWTIFEGTPNAVKREQARVTLGLNKTISLNRVAYEAMGKPIAIELRFDQNLKKIGLRPTDPARRNAFPLRPKKGSQHRWIAAGAFLTHFNISTDRTVLFEEVDIDTEGILVLDLTKTINVAAVRGEGHRQNHPLPQAVLPKLLAVHLV